MQNINRRIAMGTCISAAASGFVFSRIGIAQETTDPPSANSKPPESAVVVADASVTPNAYDAGSVRFLCRHDVQKVPWSAVELTETPGYRTPMHRHRTFDELYYVLEGTLTAQVGEQIHELPAGSLLYLPRGVAHAQGNLTDHAVKTLLTLTPGGFEEFFADRVELHKTHKPDTPEFMNRMTEIASKHDLEFISWWNPER